MSFTRKAWFYKTKKKNLKYKVYSLYCWSKLLFSHFSLKSAFVSQRPWYLPLYLPFYHCYWKHGNYCETVKLQASFWLHGSGRDGALCSCKVLISFPASRRRVHLTLKITGLWGRGELGLHLKLKITDLGERGLDGIRRVWDEVTRT